MKRIGSLICSIPLWGFWTGYDKVSGDKVNWTCTIAHEAIHKRDVTRSLSEADVEDAAFICSGNRL